MVRDAALGEKGGVVHPMQLEVLRDEGQKVRQSRRWLLHVVRRLGRSSHCGLVDGLGRERQAASGEASFGDYNDSNDQRQQQQCGTPTMLLDSQ